MSDEKKVLYADNALYFVASAVWNSYMLKYFQESYYKGNESKLTHFKKHILDTLVKCEKRESRRQQNLTQESDDESDTLQVRQTKNNNRTIQATAIAKLFLKTFSTFEKRLKENDEKLVKDPKCVFFAHLQLSVIYPTFSKHDKVKFWKFINGAYLILEMFNIIPYKTLMDIETLVKKIYEEVIVNKREMTKKVINDELLFVLNQLSMDKIQQISDFLWDFVMSENTPLPDLVPSEFRMPLRVGIRVLRRDDGKEMFVGKMDKYIKPLKDKIESDGKIKLEETTLETFSKLSEEEQKTEKKRLLSIVVDMLSSILGENRETFNTIMSDPRASVVILAEKYGNQARDLFLSFVAGESEDNEEELEEKKNRHLKGALKLTHRKAT